MEIEKHPLEPFLPAKAKLLMLGSFPPQKKRWSMDFYYPNLNNDMWRIFGILFFDDKDYFLNETRKAFCRERIIDFLNEKGIALFDTASSIRRLQDNASDKFLEVVEATDVTALLRQLPECKAIVTTGQKATFISTKVLLEYLSPLQILFSRFLLGYIALWCLYPHRSPNRNSRDIVLY